MLGALPIKRLLYTTFLLPASLEAGFLSGILNSSTLMSNEPTLQEIIWQYVAAIPRGSVATYGQIAKLCGYPSHARYVGTVLKQLPSDSRLPWHRVVNAKGETSFPSNHPCATLQRERLESEGVVFKNSKIRLSDYLWDLR